MRTRVRLRGELAQVVGCAVRAHCNRIADRPKAHTSRGCRPHLSFPRRTQLLYMCLIASRRVSRQAGPHLCSPGVPCSGGPGTGRLERLPGPRVLIQRGCSGTLGSHERRGGPVRNVPRACAKRRCGWRAPRWWWHSRGVCTPGPVRRKRGTLTDRGRPLGNAHGQPQPHQRGCGPSIHYQ